MKHIKHKKESEFKNIIDYNKSLIKSIIIIFISIFIVFASIGIIVNIKIHKERMINLQNEVYSMENEIEFYSRKEKVYNNTTSYHFTTIKTSKNNKSEELYLTVKEEKPSSTAKEVSTASINTYKPSTTIKYTTTSTTKYYTTKINTTKYTTTHLTTIKEEHDNTTNENITEETSIITNNDEINYIN